MTPKTYPNSVSKPSQQLSLTDYLTEIYPSYFSDELLSFLHHFKRLNQYSL